MKRLLTALGIGLATLGFSNVASAQYRDGPHQSGYGGGYHGHGDHHQGRGYGPGYGYGYGPRPVYRPAYTYAVPVVPVVPAYAYPAPYVYQPGFSLGVAQP